MSKWYRDPAFYDPKAGEKDADVTIPASELNALRSENSLQKLLLDEIEPILVRVHLELCTRNYFGEASVLAAWLQKLKAQKGPQRMSREVEPECKGCERWSQIAVDRGNQLDDIFVKTHLQKSLLDEAKDIVIHCWRSLENPALTPPDPKRLEAWLASLKTPHHSTTTEGSGK